jgi:biopolymer transport protein ExbB/TolQ
MLTFFVRGGMYMWPLLIFAIIIVALAVKKFIDFSHSTAQEKIRLDIGTNAILFWGVLSLLLGIFAHFHGVYLAMMAIERANDISPAIVAEGYAMSLITVLSGLFILMVAGILWLVLRWRYNVTIKGE